MTSLLLMTPAMMQGIGVGSSCTRPFVVLGTPRGVTKNRQHNSVPSDPQNLKYKFEILIIRMVRIILIDFGLR